MFFTSSHQLFTYFEKTPASLSLFFPGVSKPISPSFFSSVMLQTLSHLIHWACSSTYLRTSGQAAHQTCLPWAKQSCLITSFACWRWPSLPLHTASSLSAWRWSVPRSFSAELLNLHVILFCQRDKVNGNVLVSRSFFERRSLELGEGVPCCGYARGFEKAVTSGARVEESKRIWLKGLFNLFNSSDNTTAKCSLFPSMVKDISRSI